VGYIRNLDAKNATLTEIRAGIKNPKAAANGWNITASNAINAGLAVGYGNAQAVADGWIGPPAGGVAVVIGHPFGTLLMVMFQTGTFFLTVAGAAATPLQNVFTTVTVDTDSGPATLVLNSAAANYITNPPDFSAQWSWNPVVQTWSNGVIYKVRLT
jgi:hypothetical protein